MPVAAVAAAAIGGAATVYGASQTKKAANKTAEANERATDKQIAAQQAALDKITNLNQPFITGGAQGFSALLSALGITGAAPAAAPAPALRYGAAGNMVRVPAQAPTSPMSAPMQEETFAQAKARVEGRAAAQPAATGATTQAPTMPAQQSGQPDYAAYYAQNPDLQAEYARLKADPATASQFATPEAYAQFHAQTFGDRPVPTSAPAQAPAPAPAPDPNAPPNLMNAARPDAAAAPSFDGRAPDLNSFFSNFEADPGAAYRRDQALDSVNAKSAVRGKLRSGDAAKALATLGSDLASQEFNNWFNRQNTLYNNSRNAFQNDRAYDTGMWQYGVDRGDRNFNTDRSYQTSRDDTRIGNLFDLTRIGTGAAGNVSGAVTNNANAQTGIYGSQANNQADAAYARANANAGMAGSLAGAATNLFANWGGSSGSQTNAAQPFNRTGFNQWATGTW
jgi:hypothetical protein